MRSRLTVIGCLIVALGLAPGVRADTVTIAVAANFLAPAERLAAAFEADSGHRVVTASGSTGQLYAQIVNGAPFDLLLAADAERPRLLAESGVGVPGTVATYAIGRLALWSRDAGRVDSSTLSHLGDTAFRWLAIAEPEVAPYGQGARQVLEHLGLWDALQSRIVRGQSVAQTFALAETGNADLAFVALSQAVAYQGNASFAIVPAGLHEPIRQDLVLLRRAADNAAARAFLGFLQSPAAAGIIENYGYDLIRTPGDPR